MANKDMFEGYCDGLDLDSPEPNENRSASYRHGFECARSDRARVPAFGSAVNARLMAEKAEARDAARLTPSCDKEMGR